MKGSVDEQAIFFPFTYREKRGLCARTTCDMSATKPTFATGSCNLFVAGEYALPVIVIATLSALLARKKISKATFILYWVGVVLGACWEFSHAFIRPTFIHVNPCVSKYMPPSVYSLLHSLHDGMLFLIGYLLVLAVFRHRLRGHALGAFAVMFSFFVVQELAVEMAFNGPQGYWEYVTDERNPALFRFGKDLKRTVNVIPVLEWVLAGTLFFGIAMYVHARCGCEKA